MAAPIKRIAIFASGEGTNFTALCHAFAQQNLPLKVCLLVCDHENANVLERAAHENVPTLVVNFKDHPDKAAAERIIVTQLAAKQVDFILLAGYMRIIGPTLLAEYMGKIINIHPALLPLFPGRHGIEDAYQARVSETGVTIHWVDSGIDSGQIIAQSKVPVYQGDSLPELEARIHTREHEFYPAVVKELLEKGEI